MEKYYLVKVVKLFRLKGVYLNYGFRIDMGIYKVIFWIIGFSIVRIYVWFVYGEIYFIELWN